MIHLACHAARLVLFLAAAALLASGAVFGHAELVAPEAHATVSDHGHGEGHRHDHGSGAAQESADIHCGASILALAAGDLRLARVGQALPRPPRSAPQCDRRFAPEPPPPRDLCPS